MIVAQRDSLILSNFVKLFFWVPGRTKTLLNFLLYSPFENILHEMAKLVPSHGSCFYESKVVFHKFSFITFLLLPLHFSLVYH